MRARKFRVADPSGSCALIIASGPEQLNDLSILECDDGSISSDLPKDILKN